MYFGDVLALFDCVSAEILGFAAPCDMKAEPTVQYRSWDGSIQTENKYSQGGVVGEGWGTSWKFQVPVQIWPWNYSPHGLPFLRFCFTCITCRQGLSTCSHPILCARELLAPVKNTKYHNGTALYVQYCKCLQFPACESNAREDPVALSWRSWGQVMIRASLKREALMMNGPIPFAELFACRSHTMACVPMLANAVCDRPPLWAMKSRIWLLASPWKGPKRNYFLDNWEKGTCVQSHGELSCWWDGGDRASSPPFSPLPSHWLTVAEGHAKPRKRKQKLLGMIWCR